MSFAFKRRVGAKNLNLGPRMSVKNWNTEKKNRGRNWEELKNIYPWGSQKLLKWAGNQKDALNSYFLKNNKQQGGAWHFLTRAGQQDITMIGKTEKSIMEIKSSLPFMK